MTYRLDAYVKDVLNQKLKGKKKIKVKQTNTKVIKMERTQESINDIASMFFCNLFELQRDPAKLWFAKSIDKPSHYTEEKMLKSFHEFVKKRGKKGTKKKLRS